MQAISLDDPVVKALNLFEGLTPEERLVNSLKEGLINRLKECNNQISLFESKYGISFPQFDKLWEKDEILDKHSHEVEGDYMDWEALEMEKEKLLRALAEIKKLTHPPK